MTAFTDDDVDRLLSVAPGQSREYARTLLDAVAPAIAARARADEAEAQTLARRMARIEGRREGARTSLRKAAAWWKSDKAPGGAYAAEIADWLDALIDQVSGDE